VRICAERGADVGVVERGLHHFDAVSSRHRSQELRREVVPEVVEAEPVAVL
jgi:hypothetical protein